GDIVIDPDAEVQAAIRDVLAAFAACGSAYGVVAVFRDRRFPLRAYGGARAGQLRWGKLTHARVLGVLKNPWFTPESLRYAAGAEGAIRRLTALSPHCDFDRALDSSLVCEMCRQRQSGCTGTAIMSSSAGKRLSGRYQRYTASTNDTGAHFDGCSSIWRAT